MQAAVDAAIEKLKRLKTDMELKQKVLPAFYIKSCRCNGNTIRVLTP